MTWYRFVGKAGNRLPESPNSLAMEGKSACGTHATAYIKNSHPNLGDGIVSRGLCFAWSGESCFGQPVHSKNIDVLACKDSNGDVFHIYKLFKPVDCSYAYCAEGTLIRRVGC